MTLLFEHERQFEHRESQTTELFGYGDTQELCRCERCPKVAIDAIIGMTLDLYDAFDGRLVGEDLPRQTAQRLLFFGEREVHSSTFVSARRGSCRDPPKRRSRAALR